MLPLLREGCSAFAEADSIDQHELHVTASIGVSVYPEDGLDAETLIKNADLAMYQSKDDGRQNYQFFEPAMNIRAVARHSIEESLRRALERKHALVYQPKVSLKTGGITGQKPCSVGRIRREGPSLRRNSFPSRKTPV